MRAVRLCLVWPIAKSGATGANSIYACWSCPYLGGHTVQCLHLCGLSNDSFGHYVLNGLSIKLRSKLAVRQSIVGLARLRQARGRIVGNRHVASQCKSGRCISGGRLRALAHHVLNRLSFKLDIELLVRYITATLARVRPIEPQRHREPTRRWPMQHCRGP
jgi:hypothetical protein